MKSMITCGALVALTFSLTACGGAQTKAAPVAAGPATAKLPDSAVCPVSKEKFKPTATTKSAVHDGKTYYFCCPGCDGKFAANPDKYLAAGPAAAATPGEKKPCSGDCTKDCADCANPNKVGTAVKASELGGTLPEKTTCPVSGKEFTPDANTLAAKHGGKTHYFCCGGCAGKFAKEPAKYATN